MTPPKFVRAFSNEYTQVGVFEQPILDYLNAGGSISGLREALQQADWNTNARDFVNTDLTGDGIPELLVSLDYLYVFGCQDEQYVKLFEMRGISWPGFLGPKDMNRDGVPEIVAYTTEPSSIWSAYLHILEWNGHQFADLVTQPTFQIPHVDGGVSDGVIWITHFDPNFMKESDIIRDVDGDGLIELIVSGGVPVPGSGAYSEFGPFRAGTVTFKWNGNGFVFVSIVLEPPQYRFQAVQDGDEAALTGKYSEALEFYQQVIFSDQLEWWSPERWFNEQAAYRSQYTHEPTPTPVAPNPNEYYYLAAYARYRIMLLHLLYGTESDAKIVYGTLQGKFPVGQPGHEFAEVAERFWDEYQTTHNMGRACLQAIDLRLVTQEVSPH